MCVLHCCALVVGDAESSIPARFETMLVHEERYMRWNPRGGSERISFDTHALLHGFLFVCKQ
jgi:hypothetical protein